MDEIWKYRHIRDPVESSTLNESEVKQRSVFRQRNQAIFLIFFFNFLWPGTQLSPTRNGFFLFLFKRYHRCRPKVFPRLAETICWDTLQRNVTVKERLLQRIHLLRFSLSFCARCYSRGHTARTWYISRWYSLGSRKFWRARTLCESHAAHLVSDTKPSVFSKFFRYLLFIVTNTWYFDIVNEMLQELCDIIHSGRTKVFAEKLIY